MSKLNRYCFIRFDKLSSFTQVYTLYGQTSRTAILEHSHFHDYVQTTNLYFIFFFLAFCRFYHFPPQFPIIHILNFFVPELSRSLITLSSSHRWLVYLSSWPLFVGFRLVLYELALSFALHTWTAHHSHLAFRHASTFGLLKTLSRCPHFSFFHKLLIQGLVWDLNIFINISLSNIRSFVRNRIVWWKMWKTKVNVDKRFYVTQRCKSKKQFDRNRGLYLLLIKGIFYEIFAWNTTLIFINTFEKTINFHISVKLMF